MGAPGRGVESGPDSAQRFTLFALIGACLALVGAHVAHYTPLLAQSGAALYVAEPVVLLVLYAGGVYLATRTASRIRRVALRDGVIFGVASGVLWVANQFIETFTDIPGLTGIAATAPLLLGGFALWGVAAFRTARRTGAFGLSVLGAVWAGMLCALVTIIVGFGIAFAALPRLEQELIGDPDFVRTGWADLHAFVVANAFDAAFSHMLGVLVVGSIVGIAGAGLGLLVSRGSTEVS